jgi:putative tryptophan/tyrosine transport system substrate-binding protein
MRRREFIGLAGAAVAWPVEARGQQAMPIVGFLSSRSPNESSAVVDSFRKGLQEAGFIDGNNVAVTFRWAEGNYERLHELATDLVRMRVAVLFAAGGPPSALAAKRATSTIPIVFSATSDPVRLGLVASLNRPGGNITGMSTLVPELAAKSIEVVKEMAPKAAVIVFLVNPTNPSGEFVAKQAQTAAMPLGIQLHVLKASTVPELDEVFATLERLRADALVVPGEPFFDSQRMRIVALSRRYRIVGCYPWRDYVVEGGLMSYGTSLPDSYREAGIYVGRILNGEKPANLPVMQPRKFELIINSKTAKALGITVPPTLLARADEVIE